MTTRINKQCYVKSIKRDYKQLGIAAGAAAVILLSSYLVIIFRSTIASWIVAIADLAAIVSFLAASAFLYSGMSQGEVRLHSFFEMAGLYFLVDIIIAAVWVIICCIIYVGNHAAANAVMLVVVIMFMSHYTAVLLTLPLARAKALCTEHVPDTESTGA